MRIAVMAAAILATTWFALSSAGSAGEAQLHAASSMLQEDMSEPYSQPAGALLPRGAVSLQDPKFWEEARRRSGRDLSLVAYWYAEQVRDDGHHVVIGVAADRWEMPPGFVYILSRTPKTPDDYLSDVRRIAEQEAVEQGYRGVVDLRWSDWQRYRLLGERACPRRTAPDPGLPDADTALDALEPILKRRLPPYERVTFTVMSGQLLEDRRTEPWRVIYRVYVRVVGHEGWKAAELARFYLDVPYRPGTFSDGHPAFWDNVGPQLASLLDRRNMGPGCTAPNGVVQGCPRGGVRSRLQLERLDSWWQALPPSRWDMPAIPPKGCGR